MTYEPTTVTLSEFRVKELRELAKFHGLAGASRMNKDNLIAELSVYYEVDEYSEECWVVNHLPSGETVDYDEIDELLAEVPDAEKEAIAAEVDAAKYADSATAVAALAPNPVAEFLLLFFGVAWFLLVGAVKGTYWAGYYTGLACRWTATVALNTWELLTDPMEVTLQTLPL